MLRTQKVKLYPNQTMKRVLDDLCDYRRYCWNQGLALWNDMYDASVILADKKHIVWAGKLSQVKAMKMHKFVHMN